MPQLDSPSHLPQYLGFICLFWPFHMILAWRVLPLASQLFEFRAKVGMEKEKTQLWPFHMFYLTLANGLTEAKLAKVYQLSKKHFQNLYEETGIWIKTAAKDQINEKNYGTIQQTYIQSLGEQSMDHLQNIQQLEALVGPFLANSDEKKSQFQFKMIARQEAFDLFLLEQLKEVDSLSL